MKVKSFWSIWIFIIALLLSFTTIHKAETPEVERPSIDDIVCYYGCPNSKRVKKLRLRKR